MMRASALFGSEWVRFGGAALGAVAAAGVAGYLVAGWSIEDARPGPALSGDASASDIARSASIKAPAGAASGLEAARPQVEVTEAGARTDQIWEVSIGADAAAAAGMSVAPLQAWRIGGVFESEAGPALIVESGGAGPSRYLRVGDLLPNKAKIVAITRDTVTVRTRINRRWVLVSLNV